MEQINNVDNFFYLILIYSHPTAGRLLCENFGKFELNP